MKSAAPVQFLIFVVAGWLARQQGEAIEYLRAENGVLRVRLGAKRLRLTDAGTRLAPRGPRAVVERSTKHSEIDLLHKGIDSDSRV